MDAWQSIWGRKPIGLVLFPEEEDGSGGRGELLVEKGEPRSPESIEEPKSPAFAGNVVIPCRETALAIKFGLREVKSEGD